MKRLAGRNTGGSVLYNFLEIYAQMIEEEGIEYTDRELIVRFIELEMEYIERELTDENYGFVGNEELVSVAKSWLETLKIWHQILKSDVVISDEVLKRVTVEIEGNIEGFGFMTLDACDLRLFEFPEKYDELYKECLREVGQ